MSTRATILIESKVRGKKARIYHHSDGYPEGVGSDLKEFLKGIEGGWYVEDIANDIIKGKCGDDFWYEFTTCQHGDEEYAYYIDCDGKTLKCYSIGWDDTDWPKASKEVEIPD